jgi:hypothetical protein
MDQCHVQKKDDLHSYQVKLVRKEADNTKPKTIFVSVKAECAKVALEIVREKYPSVNFGIIAVRDDFL